MLMLLPALDSIGSIGLQLVLNRKRAGMRLHDDTCTCAHMSSMG